MYKQLPELSAELSNLLKPLLQSNSPGQVIPTRLVRHMRRDTLHCCRNGAKPQLLHSFLSQGDTTVHQMAKLHAQSEAFMRNTELPFKSPALRQKHCNKADLMLWVRPTSLDKTLPLRSVVVTPAGPPSQRSLQAGGSLAQETSETLNSWPNTTVSLSPSPPREGHQPYHHCFMPSTACQCLPVTQAVWMGLDITLPQGPSHALHLLGMPQRLHSPHAWQDPNLCSRVHSFPSNTHRLKPVEQFNFSMSTPILKTAKHPESCTCSYLLASHPAPSTSRFVPLASSPCQP